MKARDVGIGLAVAWARQTTGRDIRCAVVSSFGSVDAGMPDERWVMIAEPPPAAPDKVWGGMQRGPTLELMVLTDTRVAFGIAMAHAGARHGCPTRYLRRGWGFAGVERQWSTGIVDLVPSRWDRFDP